MIRWKRKALKDLKRLPQNTINRIVERINQFYERGYGDVKPLHGSLANFYRLRGGCILTFSRSSPIFPPPLYSAIEPLQKSSKYLSIAPYPF